MKRSLALIAILTGLGAIIVQGVTQGQNPAPRPAPTSPPGDLGPGDQGATLKQPWMEPPGKNAPPAGNSLQNLWNPAVNSGSPNRSDASNPFVGHAAFLGGKVAQPPTNPTDINRDIELTKEQGTWVIFLIAYSGEKAPQLARKCVTEMRTNPKYRLNAFVFNYGAEEKRKEFERVQKMKEEQIQNKARLQETLAKQGVYGEIAMPIRVQAVHIEEQTGVLIAGGFKTREEAQEALKAIRKLPNPDPTKIDMEVISNVEEKVEPGMGRTPRVNQTTTGKAYVSPFVNAFVARNPCLPKETPVAEQEKIDMGLLRKLNASEPYCLLACKQKFTLVVKQFNTQVMVQDRPKQAVGFMDSVFKKQDSVDYAAKNAVSLVELLRRGGCNEAYVLHTKFCSYVTVGGFDSLSDPRIAGTQTALQKGFRELASNDPRLAQVIQSLDLPTQFQPMLIPH